MLDRHGLEELLVEREPAHDVVEEPADPFDLGVGPAGPDHRAHQRRQPLVDARADGLQRRLVESAVVGS